MICLIFRTSSTSHWVSSTHLRRTLFNSFPSAPLSSTSLGCGAIGSQSIVSRANPALPQLSSPTSWTQVTYLKLVANHMRIAPLHHYADRLAEGMSLAEALAAVRAVRPIAKPNEGFMLQLQWYGARKARSSQILPAFQFPQRSSLAAGRELETSKEHARSESGWGNSAANTDESPPATAITGAPQPTRADMAPQAGPRQPQTPSVWAAAAPTQRSPPRANLRVPPIFRVGEPPRSASAARAPPLMLATASPRPGYAGPLAIASHPNPATSPRRTASTPRADPPSSPRTAGHGPVGWPSPGAHDAYAPAGRTPASPAAPGRSPARPPTQPPRSAQAAAVHGLDAARPRHAGPSSAQGDGHGGGGGGGDSDSGLLGEVKRLLICRPGRPDVVAKELTC